MDANSAGAKHPSWDSDCAYIDAALGHSCGISRKTFLPTGKILGLALVRRPRTATSFDEEGSSSSDGNGDWAYSGGSILHGKWSALRLMGSALTTEHWRVCRVMCFTQPIAGPWLLQGPPKKLSSYQQGAQLLKWVIYRLEHQHYTYAQYVLGTVKPVARACNWEAKATTTSVDARRAARAAREAGPPSAAAMHASATKQ